MPKEDVPQAVLAVLGRVAIALLKSGSLDADNCTAVLNTLHDQAVEAGAPQSALGAIDAAQAIVAKHFE
jgi:hypothetical protein